MYVKVYGTIRVFNKEKAIVGTHIKRLDKLDDVTNHLLQVFVAHCIRKKGVLTNRDLSGAHQVSEGTRPATMGGPSRLGGGLPMSSSDPKTLVLSVMKEINKTSKFIPKSDVYSHLQQQISREVFEKALGSLADNGVIYSTYDADIYSITE